MCEFIGYEPNVSKWRLYSLYFYYNNHLKKDCQINRWIINKIVTKVYSRVNGVLDVEVAGYGRIRIKESSLLDDVDKICKDRYVKWIEGKSSEGVSTSDGLTI